MLIEFSVGNFRSFKEPVTLSMVTSKGSAKLSSVNFNNTIQISSDLIKQPFFCNFESEISIVL